VKENVGTFERWQVGRLGVRKKRKAGQGRKKEEERFLSAQADAFAGAKAGEKVGLLRSK
jgi:hypothetical protein